MAIKAHKAKDKLTKKGQTVKAWAMEHGFKLGSVHAVLSGHNKGKFGESHRIAIALCIKDAPE